MTLSPENKLWSDLTSAELDRAYNNSAAVAHSTQTVSGWEQRSAIGLCRQSADYAATRAAAKLPGGFVEIPSADHFSILQHLESADGVLCDIVSRLAGGDTSL